MWIYYFNPTTTNFMRLLATVLILCCVLIFLGCPWKECTSPERAYMAHFNITHPDTIKVGDTIWIESIMDCKNMYNSITGSTDEFCNQMFSNNLFVNYMVDSLKPMTAPAIHMFDYVATYGRIYNDRSIPQPDRVNQLEFGNQNDLYKLKFGLLCKNSGNYYIVIGNGGSFGKDYCDRSSLSTQITNSNRKIEIYEQYIAPRPMTEVEKERFFVFEVSL
jgi:hypothetical protein